jgi:tetratricopeptide (TPR) repeat protein
MALAYFAQVDRDVLARASRRAWLALEVALAGPPFLARLGQSLPRERGNRLRQQLEALLDLLALAGLDSDDPNLRRGCAEELRAARRANLLADDGLAAVQQGQEAPSPDDAAADEPAQLLARDLEQAGYPRLARLLDLRLPWDEPLFLGMRDHFVRRSLPGRHDETGAGSWRCLETTAPLLEKYEQEVLALLDGPEESWADEGDVPTVERLVQLGSSLFRKGDYRQAVAQFTAASRLDPGNALLYAQRGDSYRLLCEYDRAITDYQLALRLGPSSPAVLLGRAIAYHLGGENDRAVADCDALVALSPDNPAVYRTRASAYGELGEYERALTDLSRAIALAPGDYEAPYLRGLVRAQQTDFAAAVADFNRTLELNPHHVPALLERGHCHRRLGGLAQAVRDYTEVLRHHPGNVAACRGLAQAHRLQGDLDRAIADITEVLRLESTSAQDYCHRGVLYRARGDLTRALDDLDEALRREPTNGPALYYRGKVFLARGQFGPALLDLTEVLRLNGTLLAAYLSRALVHDRLGQYAEGTADASRALELDGASAAAYLVRGVLRSHAGQRPLAIEDLSQAIRLDERLALAYHERGLACLLHGDHDQALADCNRLLDLEPGNAQAHATRSIVHHGKGQLEQALTDYSRALQIDPRCVLTGWNPELAETTRNQTTKRLADYIDGLRPEALTAEPPPSPFRIVLEPPAASAATAAPLPRKPSPRTPARRTRLTVPSRPGNEPVTAETRVDLTVPELPAAVAPTEPDGSPAPIERGKSEQAASDRRDEGLAHPPSEQTRPQPPKAASNKVEPAQASPSPPPRTVTCRNCGQSTTPTHLSEGRVRCGHCQSVFPLAASARPTMKRKARTEPRPTAWKWRLSIAAGIAAAALLSLVVFRSTLLGHSGRVRVYPAQGKVSFEGKPIPGATLFLHPVGVKTPGFPRPRAIVAEDGSFVLGTYRKDDGAPPGEYKVTVQWFRKATSRDVPVNLLPSRYASPETSDLAVRIQKGEKDLPPLLVKGVGRR